MMSCISYISSAAIFSKNSHIIMRTSLYSITPKRGIWHAGIKATISDFMLMRSRVQCYSAPRARASRSPKVNPGPSVEEESDAFYVVRKGDVVGIYKSLSDCQAQVSSSVCDPSVSVYKGYSLHKGIEEYLASCGLKDSLYSIKAADVKDDLFGTLVPCPFQQPDGLSFLVDKGSNKTSTKKISTEVAKNLQPGGLAFLVDEGSNKTTKGSSMEVVKNLEAVTCTSLSTELSEKSLNLGYPIEVQPISRKHMSCILEFDGASKGNPGRAGAGAIIRAEDGSVISRLSEGLGTATNNVAEYRAMILGMQYALKKGFKQIRVLGDSKLVCLQVQGKWKTRHEKMIELGTVAKELKDMFVSFQITHVRREFNSDADAQANLAVHLANGEVQEYGEIS